METISLSSVLNHHGRNYVVSLTDTDVTWYHEEHKEQKSTQKRGIYFISIYLFIFISTIITIISVANILATLTNALGISSRL